MKPITLTIIGCVLMVGGVSGFAAQRMAPAPLKIPTDYPETVKVGEWLVDTEHIRTLPDGQRRATMVMLNTPSDPLVVDFDCLVGNVTTDEQLIRIANGSKFAPVFNEACKSK